MAARSEGSDKVLWMPQLSGAMPLVRTFVKTLTCVLVTALIITAFPARSAAAPVVLGLANKHPLSQPQLGQVLLGELRCAACHSHKGAPHPLERVAPDLADVGSRVAPEFLRRFIASPSTSHSGTTMPDMLTAEPAEQRDKIAEAITHFLIAQSPRRFQRESVGKQEVSAGKALFHTVGCIACHSPRDEGGKEITRAGVIALEHLPMKHSLASLAEFLFEPMRVRPSGRMPDMKLTSVEAKALASYLLGNADVITTPLQPQAKLVALGKEHFQRFNCAACHNLSGMPAANVPANLLPVVATCEVTDANCTPAKLGHQGCRVAIGTRGTLALRDL